MRLVVCGIVLVGCSGWEEREEAGLRILETSRSSNYRGELPMKVDALPGETALLASVDPDAPDRAVFLDVFTPDDDHVFDIDAEWDSGLTKTGAIYTLEAVALNWPVTDEDVPLSEGRWRVIAGAITPPDQPSEFVVGAPFDVRVTLKADDDFTRGALDARLVYVGAVGDDPEVIRATEAAVAHWTALYAAFGIDLTVRYDTVDRTEAVAAPGDGDPGFYTDVSADSELREVTIVLVDRIEDQPGVQGFAGGVPGMMLPGGRSAVAISTTYNGGADMQFTPLEIRVFGETMAHEVGHWLGLFHPVELEYDQWDALPDTPQCRDAEECEAALGDNLMYPIALCSQTDCLAQDTMTEDQRGVMHRSVWVD